MGFMNPHNLGPHPKANISYLARENCPKSHLLEKKVTSLCVRTCAMAYVGSRGQIQVVSWCLYLLLPFQGSNLQQISDL